MKNKDELNSIISKSFEDKSFFDIILSCIFAIFCFAFGIITLYWLAYLFLTIFAVALVFGFVLAIIISTYLRYLKWQENKKDKIRKV